MSVFTFKIGGEAGYGIMSAGLTFAKIATRSGYHIFDYTEYPSIIRGGHNVMQIGFSREPLYAQYRETNLLAALNQATVDRHAGEVPVGGGVLYDAEQKINVESVPVGAHLYAVPFNRLAREAGGTILMRNTVAIGAAVALLGGSIKILRELIAEEFGKKSADVVARNQAAAVYGHDYAREHYLNNIVAALKPRPIKTAPMVITGNEAVALGAVAAGLQFAAIYPMTPTSNILQVLAPLQEEYNFIYQQPEDEISAINMAIGASFAGARSMVATAGGGFCLMTEGYGLAGMTETPLVIIEGMRPGPATGLPTWTSQGDLRFVLHAHQDDFPRIVLAPGDVEEAFYFTRQAFNLADRYQTPVVVMLDKQLCESHQSAAPFAGGAYRVDRGKIVRRALKNYQRYAVAWDGISPRAFPGSGNQLVANSDEHDEFGYSSEDPDNRVLQMNKRMTKLALCAKNDMPEPKLYGARSAAITIVAWGSTKGAILEALPRLPGINFLHLAWLNPFPAMAVKKILGRAKRVVSIEGNYTGQLAGLIAETTGIIITDQFLKYDGRPFYPEDIIQRLKD